MSKLINKIISIIIIIGGVYTLIIGIQEMLAIKTNVFEKSFLKNAEKNFGKEWMEIYKQHILKNLGSEKEFIFSSGIRHFIYGIIFIISGLGIFKDKIWAIFLFMGGWILIFSINIFYFFKKISYSSILFISVGMIIFSILF